MGDPSLKGYELLVRERNSCDSDLELSRSPPPWLKSLDKPHRHGPSRAYGLIRKFFFFLQFLVLTVGLLLLLTPFLNPSYADKPAHYTGQNHRNEKVFIAAAITNADLIRGEWGKAVVELVNIIGAENTFVSVYENDSGEETATALRELEEKLRCDSSVVSEHLPLEDFPTVTLPSGEKRVKRITYLAEIRNRAMRPLYTSQGATYNSSTGTASDAVIVPNMDFDKVLFLNDVVFSATDAADLLFSTRVGPDMRTHYRAACAVDFVDPVKFYDTFATRDTEGFVIGVPFFPWFTGAGNGESRRDVLAETDAVRVRSCWGGMVAFEARWFTPEARPTSLAYPLSDNTSVSDFGLRFRGEEEVFWDASESCLIHADLEERVSQSGLEDDLDPDTYGTGIFMNPYIRVAYDQSTFRWLWLAQRFERLYPTIHSIISWCAGRPSDDNDRRLRKPGDKAMQKEWGYNHGEDAEGKPGGCYQDVERTALPGGFCGSRKLLTLKKHYGPGERMWEGIPVPSLDDSC